MINGVYITGFDIYDSAVILRWSGVINKINEQYSVLRKYFNMRMDVYKNHDNTFLSKLIRRLPFCPYNNKWKIRNGYTNIDFLYIRKDIIDGYFIKFLKNIKHLNQNIIILFEIPTYPYDKEFRFIIDFPFFLKDYLNRNKLKKYLTKIVTLSSHEKIFNIKTIKIINGIDISKIQIISNKKNDDSINLISVSTMFFWHGYDRLIKGIAEYYSNGGKRKIHLDIVGSGESFNLYNKLICKNNLNDVITMHGFQQGIVLDKLYSQSDIAVSTLGFHRSGISSHSALKSREYLAHGLPIISSSKINGLPENFTYCLYVPADESPIELNSVIDFYDKIDLKRQREDINMKIRNFAENNLDISKTFLPVIEYLSSESGR